MNPQQVLILPGWRSSGPNHWQTIWEKAHGYTRVEQHSWVHPKRGDWIARLEDVLLSCDEPAVLVAHSLGCIHVAAWASHSKNTARVKAALLVAPPDLERDDVRDMLPSWPPMPLQKLPFETVLFSSDNDPYCSVARAQQFAGAWGSEIIEIKNRGHLNDESGLGDWPLAHDVLLRLIALPGTAKGAQL